MDTEAIKVLLETQERTFKTALDIVVEQLNARIQIAEGTIADLIKSLEFTQKEVKDLQCEVKVLRKSDIDNKATIDFLKLKVEELERRANYQEDYNRRNNLRITGIREQSGGETWEETAKIVSELLEEKMQLPSMKIERAHRIGPVAASQPRTVVVRFERFGDREAVIRNARKLKGSGIYINEDLCPASLELKKSQIPLMKKAREEGKIAFFKHTKLIIKERTAQRSGTTSGEHSTSGADGLMELRSAGAVAGGVEVRPDVEPVGVGVGGGKGAPSSARPGAAAFDAQSPVPADGATVPRAPDGAGNGARTPDAGGKVAAGCRTPGGSVSDLESSGGALQRQKSLRNRKKDYKK